MKWNQFIKDREALDIQYVDAWHNEESYKVVRELKEKVLDYAESIKDESHPAIKAKCFEFLAKNANVRINPDDWFGIAMQTFELNPIYDTGSPTKRILISLTDKWTGEIKEEMFRLDDKHFIENVKFNCIEEFYVDYNHSSPCWEDIFNLGIKGLLERALEYKENLGKESPLTTQQKAFFEGIEITYNAILNTFDRYVEILKDYNQPKMVCMREAFKNLRNNPPKNTYEALLLSWQFWLLEETVDCFRCRTMGRLDELYFDFYKNDIKNGTFTKEQITELFAYFMNEFNAMRVFYQQPMYIGGMDPDGNSDINELSYVVLDAYNILRRPNPKLQVKICDTTPDKFLLYVLETIRNGNSSISIINDNNAAKSLMKLGVPREEAYTTIMTGCWDYAVKYHEVKTIPVRVSLPKILEYTMTNGVCLTNGAHVGWDVGENFETFEDFLNAYKLQWKYIWQKSRSIIENWEKYLEVISPSNIFSATMTDALKRGVDGYSKGMKYNTTIYQCAGLATLVDSLCAIKKHVFDKKELTIKEFVEVLKANWVGYEDLRNNILNDEDKYGNGSELADGIMMDLTKFFASQVNGVPNSRGSFWKMGTLSINKNVFWGKRTKATPDGRLEGEPLSRNLSPVIGMDKKGITTLLNSVSKIDFTDYPNSGILDVILHPTAVSGEDGLNVFLSVVRTYFKKGGHSIQFNVFDAKTLKEAQKNPDKYRNLQVRVCGWNVYFVDLSKLEQDDFIRRCEHNESVR